MTREISSSSKVAKSTSRGYTSQKTPEAMLDSAHHLTSQAIECLNESSQKESEQLLILGICSISGALFQLRRMLQDPKTQKEWMPIADILCAVPGPLQTLAADMDYIILKYPSSFLLKTLDSLSMFSEDQKELAEIRARVENLKAIFIFTLRNDPM